MWVFLAAKNENYNLKLSKREFIISYNKPKSKVVLGLINSRLNNIIWFSPTFFFALLFLAEQKNLLFVITWELQKSQNLHHPNLTFSV